MKAFLIFLNICLAGGIFWSILKQAKTPQVNEDEYFFRKSEKEVRNASAPKAEAQTRKKSDAPDTRDSELSIRKVSEGNIFDPARFPGARIPGRRNSNAGLDMTLVGTFSIGNLSGAIIMQKKRQNASFPFPWMQGSGGPPMAMPAFQGNNAPGGGQSMPGGANSGPNNNNGGRQGGGGFARTRFGSGDMFARWRQMQNRQQNGGNAGEEAAMVYQQYVRVGETLANGYKLTAVSRTGATLMKGSEKLELEIVESSKNAGSGQNRNSTGQTSGFQGRGMMPWMMPGMMMGGMGGMGGFRGGFQPNAGGGQQAQPGGGMSGQQGGMGGFRGGRQGWQRGQ